MVGTSKSGRKAKPTAQKILNGNPGKRPLNKLEPKYDELKSADPPDWIDDYAKEAWAFYSPILIAQKILTSADLHNLTAFCCAFSRFKQGEEHIKHHGIVQDGETGLSKNPASTIINEALKQMQMYGSALGLDPASRQRLIAPKSENANPFTLL